MVLSVLLLAGAAACGSGDDRASSPAEQTSTSAGPATTAASRTAPNRVVLDDPGGQPRQPLLLQVPAGTTNRVALVTKLGLKMTLDGESLPIGVVPSTRMVLTQEVDKVDPDGTTHYTVTFTDVAVLDTPGADPSVVSQTGTALNELKGLKGTGTVDVHGALRESSFDTRSTTNPLLKSTLESVSSQISNLSAPFPSEPVGPGARWTATRSATINGITMNMTSRYTLRSRTGTRYEVEVVQDSSAPPGAAAIPNLPGGATASITSFTVHTTGTLSGDLTKPLPTAGTTTGTGDGVMTVSQGAERGEIRQHLDLDFTISPA